MTPRTFSPPNEGDHTCECSADLCRHEGPELRCPPPDCGSSSCRYTGSRCGMRNNGGCRCDRCPACNADVRPKPHPRTHQAWCPQRDWLPYHHRPEAP
jgi:hypothetical protein